MKFSFVVCLLAAIGAAALRADLPIARELFDGRTLQGWHGSEKSWRVEDGAITGEIRNGETLADNQFLYWEGEVGDFELELEFRMTGIPSANSGIQFRSLRRADGHAQGYQADLDDGATWLGRIYDEEGRALLVERGSRVAIAPDGRRWVDTFAAPESFKGLFKAGEWNRYRITARASHVEVWINGTLVSVLGDHQADHARFAGKLAFQLHSGKGPAKVQFRSIRLIDLGRTAVPAAKQAAARPDKVEAFAPTADDGRTLNFDFETGDLTDWAATGNAWEGQPFDVAPRGTGTRRSDEGDVDPTGRYAVTPYWNAPNVGTGALTSVPFPVTHRWASYIVGGRDDINQHRVEFVLEDTGAVVHSAPGGKRRLEVVDLQSLLGKKLRIRLVDNLPGPGAQILFDAFSFHDSDPSVVDPKAEREARLYERAVLWHLQPNPAAPSAVPNADAQRVVRDLKLQPGFAADLIAAEPDVHQPIAFAIDPKGRLWVAEAYSYPIKRAAGEGKDRITIFEDRDGNGSFETRKVFTEGLNLVSGLEVGFGGVWVGAAPELLFIPDRNGDDKPDGPPLVLLDGWGYQDTHETLNSFTWGPDGWLYGLQGVFTESNVGKPGAPDAQRHNLRAGVWRYHPVRHVFEIFAHGGSNQWGIDFNTLGSLFITHCRSFWGGGGTTYVIRNGHYWNQANANYAPFISNQAPDFAPALRNYLPSSAQYDSGEGGAGKPGTTAVYGGHSHVGTMIYLGDNWPEIYRDHLFTHNLHGHQINHQHNVRDGSGYETFHAGHDLLFAPDTTYLPVDLQYGPDGGVYVIDWCDHQHCHSPRDDVWERHNGRIYRVVWSGTWRPAKVDLAARSDSDLAKLHTHRNEWHVRTARRLLQERATQRPIDDDALEQLRAQAATRGSPAAALRAWFTLHVVGAVTEADLQKMLASDADAIRAWAVTFATENAASPDLGTDQLRALATSDPSPVVRLAVASALPTLAPTDAWAIGTVLATKGEDANDRFLPRMIWFGLAPHAEANLSRSLKLAAATALPTLRDSLQWFVARTAAGREALVKQLLAASPAEAAGGVQVMAFALASDTALPMPTGWPALAQRIASPEATPEVRQAARELSALFGDDAVLAQARALLADRSAPLDSRRDAFRLLQRADDRSARAVYLALLEDPAFRREAVIRLARFGDPAAAAAMLQDFEKLNDADRAASLALLTGRPAYALTLLDAIEGGTFPRNHLTALHLRQLRDLHNAEVDARTDRIWIKSNSAPPDAAVTIAQLRKVYEGAPTWAFDAAKGQQHFQQLCASCHLMNGEGGLLGPDLTTAWRNGLDYFLENVVDPNGVVGTDFQLNLVTRKDGSVLSGMIERETDTAIIVRTATETVSVPRTEVASRQVLPQSLMPPGLFESLSEEQYIELMKFLLSRK
jgi:putative membrane-bound dehydrogenase-like protein